MSRSYNPLATLFSAYDRRVTEFADGDFISIVPFDDDFRVTTGADGVMVFTATGNTAVVVGVTLQQTSPANDIFTDIFNVDRSAPNGSVGTVVAQDTAGTTEVSGRGRITRRPDIVFSKDAGNRVWVFHVDTRSGIWRAGSNPED